MQMHVWLFISNETLLSPCCERDSRSFDFALLRLTHNMYLPVPHPVFGTRVHLIVRPDVPIAHEPFFIHCNLDIAKASVVKNF